MTPEMEQLLEEMAKAASKVWSKNSWEHIHPNYQRDAIKEVQESLKVFVKVAGLDIFDQGRLEGNAIDACVALNRMALTDYKPEPMPEEDRPYRDGRD